jgi:ketosteroid isomerase-like protein
VSHADTNAQIVHDYLDRWVMAGHLRASKAVDALLAENQQLRDALEAAQQLWDFLENEKATYEPPRELLDQGIVACETAEDYDKEERLSEALGAALAAVRVEER